MFDPSKNKIAINSFFDKFWQKTWFLWQPFIALIKQLAFYLEDKKRKK